MAKFKVWGACAVGGVALLALAGSLVSVPAHAGEGKPRERMAERKIDPGTVFITHVELRQVHVREALTALFRHLGLAYSIAPDVQGKVTLSLREVTFGEAFDAILRQVDATYRIEGGVFNVISREGPRELLSPSERASIQEANVPSAVTSDRDYLYVVRPNRVVKMRKSDLRVVSQGRVEKEIDVR